MPSFARASRVFLVAFSHLALASLCQGQSIELISEAAAVSQSASGDSTLPVWGGSSRYLGFHSDARNLTTNKVDWRQINAYLRDRVENKTWLVSVPLPGQTPNGSSIISDISTNGPRVAFVSAASNLRPDDANSYDDVYVRDVASAHTILASVDRAGTSSGNGASGNPSITPDGRFVAFESVANNLVASDPNLQSDIFVRDLDLGVTTLASIHTNTNWRGNGGSYAPQISADGRYVAFLSYSNAVTTPTIPTAAEVFLRDREQNVTLWVSSNNAAFRPAFRPAGSPSSVILASTISLSANGASVVYKISNGDQGMILFYDVASRQTRLVTSNAAPSFAGLADFSGPVMSDDGKRVAFESYTNVASPGRQIILWNADTGVSVLASRAPNGLPSTNGVAMAPAISASGDFIAFLSNAADLAPAETAEGEFQAYVFDAAAGTVSLASDRPADAAIADPDFPALSPDGRLIAYQMPGSGSAPGDLNNRHDVLVKNLETKAAELISERAPEAPSASSPAPSALVALSANGRFAAYSSASMQAEGGYELLWRNLETKTSKSIRLAPNSNALAGGWIEDPVMSADGQYLAFTTVATNIVSGDVNRARDIFLHHFQSGETFLLSRAPNGAPPVTGASGGSSISADGRWVAFQSAARNLTSDAYSGAAENVFVYDRLSNSVQLASVSAAGGSSGNNISANAFISPNGRYAAFLTRATDIVPNLPLTQNWRWMLRDLQTGTTKWIADFVFTRTTLTAPKKEGVFSADNRVFVFLSSDNPRQISAADVETGVVEQICVSCSNPSVSGDGNFIAYETFAPRGEPPQQIHLLDRAAGAISIVSRAGDPGTGGNGKSSLPRISADGRTALFKSVASDLIANDPNSLGDLFLWDRMSGLVSALTPLPAGTDVTVFGDYQISGDGNRVAFESSASSLVAGDFNENIDVFLWQRVVSGDSDNDGLPDEWETLHFGSLTQTGTGDADNDGASNLNEFRAGTNPADQNSTFRAVVSILNDGRLELKWNSVSGKSYQVQSSDTLPAAAWTNAGDRVSAAGATSTSVLPLSNDIQRFYRVVLVE